MAITIGEMYFKGMTMEQVKELNPFAVENYLKDAVEPSEGRLQDIENLFEGKDTVSADKISEINRRKRIVKGKTGYNVGKHAAFRAILHGIAKHDGNGGLIRIDKTENHVPDSLSGKNTENANYLPTKEDCNAAIRQLFDENLEGQTKQVLDRIEKNVTSKGMALKPKWRMITEENMKIWSS
jgi:hypothetical protein